MTSATALAQEEDPQTRECDNQVVVVSLKDLLLTTYTRQPDLIMARQDRVKASADLLTAKTPFLPAATASLTAGSFVSKMGAGANTPALVGSSLVGGASGYAAYPSLGINWNLYNGGKDLAQWRQAQAEILATNHDLQGAVNDALSSLVLAYGDLTKSHRLVAERRALFQLRQQDVESMSALSRQGRISQIKLEESRIAQAQSERDLFQGCQVLIEKSNALAKAAGIRLDGDEILRVDDVLSGQEVRIPAAPDLNQLADQDPRVRAMADKVSMAEHKLEQARGAYQPSVTMSARYDLLGQSSVSTGGAVSAIASNSYWVGLALQQSLGPFTSETAAVDSAQADLIKARASYEQTRVDTQNRLKTVVGEYHRARSTLQSAQQSVESARQSLELTRELQGRGMTDNRVAHEAGVLFLKEQQTAFEAAVDELVSRWLLLRVLRPEEFAQELLSRNQAGEGLAP